MQKLKPAWSVLFLGFALGVAVLAGSAFAVKATDGAAFCAGCHAMSEAAWTHKQSVHRQFDCGECHLPADLVSKMPYKTQIGLHDVYVNVTGVPDLIHSSAKMKDVVQANCRRCHAATTMDVAMDAKPYCTDCHRSVPHNKKKPIDKRKAADA